MQLALINVGTLGVAITPEQKLMLQSLMTSTGVFPQMLSHRIVITS